MAMDERCVSIRPAKPEWLVGSKPSHSYNVTFDWVFDCIHASTIVHPQICPRCAMNFCRSTVSDGMGKVG